MNTIRKVNFLDKTIYSIDGRDCLLYSTGKPVYMLVQPVDDHDREVLDEQVTAIAEASQLPFVFVAFPVVDWNGELSPWDSPAVFGSDDFGHGAAGTLYFVENELLPAVRTQFHLSDEVPVILGGYSLAALFSLWSGWQTDIFSAVAAASPSVWFPGWLDYARQQQPMTKAVYLSLGDREERTRNPIMATVGGCIRQQYAHLETMPCIQTTLEWNKGNHFQHTGQRCAKAFAWCMSALAKETDGASSTRG